VGAMSFGSLRYLMLVKSLQSSLDLKMQPCLANGIAQIVVYKLEDPGSRANSTTFSASGDIPVVSNFKSSVLL